MRWIPFSILAVLGIVLQTKVAPYLAIGSVWPDLMFLLVVHYALWGPWPEAAIGAWILGLLVDLNSTGRIGLFAFAYGGAAWGIMRVRQAVFRDHPMTQIVVTAAFALLVQMIAAIYLRYLHGAIEGLWWRALWTALFTAGLAPYVHWLLLRMGRWTGLKPGHRPVTARSGR